MSDRSASPLLRTRRRRWALAAVIAALATVPLVIALLLPRPNVPRATPEQSESAEPPGRFELVRRILFAAPSPTVATDAEPPAPEVRVSGRVVDPDGNAVAGAFVVCDDRQPEIGANANKEGVFELPSSADGCRAIARAKGFGPSTPTVVRGGVDNTVRLEPPGAIAGVVVDERGAPVTPYQVGVESYVSTGARAESGIGGASRKVDDASGAFVLEGLEPGTYVLAASADDRPPVRSGRIEVEAGRTTRHVRIVLPRGATLVGRAVDAQTGKPIAGATVALDAVSYGVSPAQASTDDAGTFRLVVLPNGPCSIRIAHEGHRALIATVDARGRATFRQDFPVQPATDGGAVELGGIGAALAPSPRGVIVAGVVAGAAGERAGLRKGDRIERIDGVAAGELTVPDCIQRLRGPAGTRVAMTVSRDGEAPREIVVTREMYVAR